VALRDRIRRRSEVAIVSTRFSRLGRCGPLRQLRMRAGIAFMARQIFRLFDSSRAHIPRFTLQSFSLKKRWASLGRSRGYFEQRRLADTFSRSRYGSLVLFNYRPKAKEPLTVGNNRY
jgi:hypothetical protein